MGLYDVHCTVHGLWGRFTLKCMKMIDAVDLVPSYSIEEKLCTSSTTDIGALLLSAAATYKIQAVGSWNERWNWGAVHA